METQLFVMDWFPLLVLLHCISNSYLSRCHPWTQTPADKCWTQNSAAKNVQEPLCDSGPCSAPLWCPCGSGNSEWPDCGTAAGRDCAQERTGRTGSCMSNSHSWAGAPGRRRTCHHPAGGAPAGRCTWSYQECWCTGGHRAVAAAHTHLCLPSTQRKTSTRKWMEGGVEK